MDRIQTRRLGGRFAAPFVITALVLLGIFAVIPAAHGDSRPLFQHPFACGTEYTAQSYSHLYYSEGRSHGPGPLRYAPLDFQQPGDADDGDPVLASAAGTVYRFDEFDEAMVGKGYVVLIDHGGDGPNMGWDTYYGHLEDATRAQDGALVQRGDVIGFVSDSNAEPDNHLHYEQRLDGNAELVEFNAVQVPYWLDNVDGQPGYWAPDAASQQQTAAGASGPVTVGPSANCPEEPPPTSTTTTTVSADGAPLSMADANSIAELVAAEDYRPGPHGEILRLYHAFFGRSPDLAGAKYWIVDVYETGSGDFGQIIGWFADPGQPEFQQQYADIAPDDHDAFLERVYGNMLGRVPDPAGFAYWLGLLEGGSLTRPAVVQYVGADTEFVRAYPYGS